MIQLSAETFDVSCLHDIIKRITKVFSRLTAALYIAHLYSFFSSRNIVIGFWCESPLVRSRGLDYKEYIIYLHSRGLMMVLSVVRRDGWFPCQRQSRRVASSRRSTGGSSAYHPRLRGRHSSRLRWVRSHRPLDRATSRDSLEV